MSDVALVDALARKLCEDSGSSVAEHVDAFRWTARTAVRFLTDPARDDDRLVPVTEVVALLRQQALLLSRLDDQQAIEGAANFLLAHYARKASRV